MDRGSGFKPCIDGIIDVNGQIRRGHGLDRIRYLSDYFEIETNGFFYNSSDGKTKKVEDEAITGCKLKAVRQFL